MAKGYRSLHEIEKERGGGEALGRQCQSECGTQPQLGSNFRLGRRCEENNLLFTQGRGVKEWGKKSKEREIDVEFMFANFHPISASSGVAADLSGWLFRKLPWVRQLIARGRTRQWPVPNVQSRAAHFVQRRCWSEERFFFFGVLAEIHFICF